MEALLIPRPPRGPHISPGGAPEMDDDDEGEGEGGMLRTSSEGGPLSSEACFVGLGLDLAMLPLRGVPDLTPPTSPDLARARGRTPMRWWWL